MINYDQRAVLCGPRHLIATQCFMLHWKQLSRKIYVLIELQIEVNFQCMILKKKRES